MAMRWNFRVGPLQLTSPVGVISGSVIAGFVLTCCGAGIIGAFSDSPDSPPPAVVETSAPATPDTSPSAEPTEQAEPTEPAGTAAPTRIVHAGAFCSHEGDVGVTTAGAAMVCRGPGDLRWRKR